MSKLKVRDTFAPDCPIRNVLSRVGDKWSLLVLHTLQSGGVQRFSELQRTLPDISQKMLTVTLRTLQQDGFVERRAYAVIPPRVEYRLTSRASTFMQHLSPLISWASENMEEILHDRTQYDQAQHDRTQHDCAPSEE